MQAAQPLSKQPVSFHGPSKRAPQIGSIPCIRQVGSQIVVAHPRDCPHGVPAGAAHSSIDADPPTSVAHVKHDCKTKYRRIRCIPLK